MGERGERGDGRHDHGNRAPLTAAGRATDQGADAVRDAGGGQAPRQHEG